MKYFPKANLENSNPIFRPRWFSKLVPKLISRLHYVGEISLGTRLGSGFGGWNLLTVHDNASFMGASNSTESVMAAKEFINAKIGNNKIVVFSKTYCPHCKRAKQTLDKVGASGKYLVIELDNRDDGSAIQDVLQEMTGARTVKNFSFDIVEKLK